MQPVEPQPIMIHAIDGLDVALKAGPKGLAPHEERVIWLQEHLGGFRIDIDIPFEERRLAGLLQNVAWHLRAAHLAYEAGEAFRMQSGETTADFLCAVDYWHQARDFAEKFPEVKPYGVQMLGKGPKR